LSFAFYGLSLRKANSQSHHTTLVHWNWELVISRGGYLFFAAFFFAPFAFFAM
jgi:hypothetical protein